MKEDFVDCPEVSGKTITSLRIFRDRGEGTECQIEFSDGTSFNLAVSTRPTVEASLLRPGAGEPQHIRRYDLE